MRKLLPLLYWLAAWVAVAAWLEGVRRGVTVSTPVFVLFLVLGALVGIRLAQHVLGVQGTEIVIEDEGDDSY